MVPLRRAALLVGVWALCGLAALWLTLPHHSFDVRIYSGAVTHWLAGGDLYDFGLGQRHLGFTYPPFAALWR